MTEFSQKELEFLEKLEEARIAISHDDIPHVKPVSFLFQDNTILVVTDYDTRTFTNVKSNPCASIVIDIYKSGNHQAICIQGEIEIVENGEEFKKFYDVFYKKFEWVKREP